MLDLKIEGATVIDGTGTAGGRADVGIEGERIVAFGDLSRESASNRMNASGRVLAPGFIDMHSHSDWSLWANRRAESKIRQGVTTEVVGNCGFSAFPLVDETRESARHFSQPVLGHAEIEWDWSDASGYFSRLEREGLGVNVATLIGHGTLRNAVLGFEKRAPTSPELASMRALLDEGMKQGAFGLSTGLCYPPGVFAATDELVALCGVVADNAGLYVTHLRDQADHLAPGLDL